MKYILSLIIVLVVSAAYGETKEKTNKYIATSSNGKWYMSLGTGVGSSDTAKKLGFEADNRMTGTERGERVGTLDMETEIDYLLSVGLKKHQIRVEGELILISADAKNVKFSKFTQPGGPSTQLSLDMVNGAITHNADIDYVGLTLGIFYDFETHTHWTPYIGERYGLMRINYDGEFAANALGTSSKANDHDIIAIYGHEIGVRYEIPNKNIHLDLGYRYTKVDPTKDIYYDSGYNLNLDGYSSEYYRFRVEKTF